MSAIAETVLLEQLRWRYATKIFDPSRKIPASTWETLFEALRLTPTGYGLEPYRVILVQDPALRQSLREASWNQSQVTDCSHYVILARETGYGPAHLEAFLERTMAARGLTRESLAGYRKVIEANLLSRGKEALRAWTARQAMIALGNLLTSAALLEVDACPLEGIDAPRYDEILGLADKGLSTLCACALGYRAEGDKYATLPKVRKSREDLLLSF